jgi:MYXO-CTERM domain-containing protein
MPRSLKGVAVIAVLMLGPRAAVACSPAPGHEVSVVSPTVPECIWLDSAFSYEAGILAVDNNCDETLRIDVISCEACGEPLTLEPSERGEMVLEDRFEEGLVIRQVLSWSLGDGTVQGEFETEVRYRDTSDACDDSGHDGNQGLGECGCAAPGPSPTGLLALGLGLAVSRRRAPVRSCSATTALPAR